MDPWTWVQSNLAGAQPLDPFSDPYTVPADLDCWARTYILTGTAVDEGILTLAAETADQALSHRRTLRVETTKSAHANTQTFTATLTVDMDVDQFPYLTPLLQHIVSFTVTVTSTCHSTKLLVNNSILNKMTFVGEEPVAWRFNEWQDTVSENAIKVPGAGPFCEDRSHIIVSITSETDYPALTYPDVVKVNDEYLFFTLFAPDETYIGTHTVVIEVDLYNYNFFNDPIQ